MSKILSWKFSGRSSWLKMGSLAIVCAVLAACSSSAAPTQPAATSPAAVQPAATSPAAESADPTATSPAPETTQPAAPAPEITQDQSAAPASVTLEIGTGTGPTDFNYDKTTLEAPAGSKITLRFTNNTTLKDEVGHNWVLVKPGQEASVLANAQAAGDNNDWLKEDDPGIIAHTALIEGETNDTITFDAPPAGVYTYLSTFPKQYEGGMKGTLTIK